MTWKQDILEVDSMVVSWWIVAFLHSGTQQHTLSQDMEEREENL